MQSLGIVILCVLSAVVYGVLHDQVTARVCEEYFTVGHPPVFRTTDPTLLGLGWGVIATWWVGLLLGIPLAFTARFGRNPKRSVWSLLRPMAYLLVVMAVCAAVAGVVGWWLGNIGLVYLVEPLDRQVPPEKHAAFLADLWAHSASYLVGFIGGLVLVFAVWRSRRSPATPT